MRKSFFLAILFISMTSVGFGSEPNDLHAWRQQKEAELRAPEGWLTVVGLEFLSLGDHKLLSDAHGKLSTEAGDRPVATLRVDSNGVQLIDFQEGMLVNGSKPAKPMLLKADDTPKYDRLQYGEFLVVVLRRGDRFALRLKDKRSPRRETFKGMQWYAANAHYRITADFLPAPAGTKVAIPNVLGTTMQLPSPGIARFTLDGAQYELTPVLSSPEAKQLFFVFKDATATKTTYGAGRFLYTDLPKDGKVVLDFNRAENPPCAFTPYATCPLAPKYNVLHVAVEAGEKIPADHY